MPQDSGSTTRYKVGIVIFVVACVFFFTGGSDSIAQSHATPRETAIAEELRINQAINASHYGEFSPQNEKWLNISGFTNDTGFAWDGLEHAQAAAQSQRAYALGIGHDTIDNRTVPASAFYRNISGSIDGLWNVISRYISSGATTKIEGNVTGPGGDVSISIEEYEIDDPNPEAIPGELSWIRATFTFDDPNKGPRWRTRLNGVHLKTDGSIVLVSTSNKLAGIFALPQIVHVSSYFDPVRRFIVRQINDTITAQIASREWIVNPWTARSGIGPDADEDDLPPQCDLVVYMQQHAPSEVQGPESVVSAIEAELQHPTGVTLSQARDMVFYMVAFSPDCGYTIQSLGPPLATSSEANHLSGPKSEVESVRTRNHLLVFGVVLVCQLRLLMLQMAEASTPSVLSRLSAPTFVLLFLGDNACSMMLGTHSLVSPELGITLLATLFISFLCSTFFDLRLVLNITAAQTSSGRSREARTATDEGSTAPAARPVVNRSEQAVEPGILPLPATAQRMTDADATPVSLPPDQDEPATDAINGTMVTRRAASSGGIHALLLTLSFLLMFATISTLSWRSSFQRPFFFCLSFLLVSIWVPQIYRNAVRNCRKALRWDFVIGQSVLRLVPLGYFYVYPYHIFWIRQHWRTMYVLTGWTWLQVVVLVSQNLFGPRWFLKDKWLPPAYDYHPVLFENADEGGLPIGAKDAGSGAVHGTKVYECVICMQDLEVRTVAREGMDEGLARGAESMMARRAYMVTPCRHIFHSKCLEAWLSLRLQCPMCREPVPAV